MNIGDKVSVRPQTFGSSHMEGKVIWIHPDKRFALVEFAVEAKGPKWGRKTDKIRLRECFALRRAKK